MAILTAGVHSFAARDSLVNAIDDAWVRLSAAGTWWSGDERIAIAAQVRVAGECELCKSRKAALSPYAVEGSHIGVAHLCGDAVEGIHRVATDASRITESWVQTVTSGDLSEEQYVEIVSIVATVTALDTFDLALGRSRAVLPAPVAGAPSRHRPAGAARDLAFVHTLSPDTLQADDPDPFTEHGAIHIHRALSLVPQEVLNFFDLDVELYLKDHEIRDFDHEFREISHAQIELIAGRASAINGCYY